MRLPALAAVIAATGAVGWLGMPLAAATPAKCPELGGVVDGSRMCQIRDTTRGYALNISYPIDYPDQQAVVDYITQTRDGYVNVAKMPGPHETSYELDTSATQYTAAIPPRNTQSVVFKTFQDVGGAHPQTFYKTFTWDLRARLRDGAAAMRGRDYSRGPATAPSPNAMTASRYRSNSANPWSDPSTTRCGAPGYFASVSRYGSSSSPVVTITK